MNRTPILLIGGGGHCRSCIDVIEMTGLYDIVGVVEADGVELDRFSPYHSAYEVVGLDADLPRLLQTTPHCLITIGQLKSSAIRQKLFVKLKALGAILPAIVSPLAHVSPTAKIGAGTIVMHQALVNASAQIGDNCIINSQALVEHDCTLANHCHASTGSKLNGEVHLGEGCFVGSGTIINQGVTLGDGVVIGSGSLVLSDCLEAGIYTGMIK